MGFYHTENYWDEVAARLGSREEGKLIAGDDEPYYRYKRSLFLQLFNRINFTGRSVLEIGSGPGGNLQLLTGKHCSRIAGADISAEMIRLAGNLLKGSGVELVKTDGSHLSFKDGSFDLVFTSTVLQHNTSDEIVKHLCAEICRVSSSEILLFERIEKSIRGNETNTGRPVSYYTGLMEPAGYKLKEVRFLPIQASFYTCGVIRKLANKKNRQEGEKEPKIVYSLQSAVLPFTRVLDRLIPSSRDLAMLRFLKIDQEKR